MPKKIKICFIVVSILFIFIFFMSFAYKIHQTGNNINKSSYDFVESILNMSSYEAKLQITVESNKTTNQYFLEQYYVAPNDSKQIVKEPASIANLETIYDGTNLIIKNTSLGLNKIYANYDYLNENILWLSSFIQDYKSKGSMEKNGQEIILSTNDNLHHYHKKLYINHQTGLPIKLVIQDNSKQTKIYIEYKEIKLNSIQENNIFAFQTEDIKKEV